MNANPTLSELTDKVMRTDEASKEGNIFIGPGHVLYYGEPEAESFADLSSHE